jgi:hypothetical protein
LLTHKVNGPANKIRARLPISKGFARMLGLFNCRFQDERNRAFAWFPVDSTQQHCIVLRGFPSWASKDDRRSGAGRNPERDFASWTMLWTPAFAGATELLF